MRNLLQQALLSLAIMILAQLHPMLSRKLRKKQQMSRKKR